MADNPVWVPEAGEVRDHLGDLSGTVVVGVDGSEFSRHALRFAAGEARTRGCPLVVVCAWSLITAPGPVGDEAGVVPPMSAFEQAVSDEVARDVDDELGDDPGCEVRLMPVHQDPGAALVEASRTALLVVVGHRGHGGFAGLLLGSVSDHLVRHGEGPVAVVR